LSLIFLKAILPFVRLRRSLREPDLRGLD